MGLKQILVGLGVVIATFMALRLYTGGDGRGLWDVLTMLSGQTPPSPEASAAASEVDAGPVQAPLRILLVGDSYLARNDVAGMLRQLALAAGKPAPVVAAIVPGGASLESHLSGGEVTQRLSSAAWDYLVLQEQGPRSASPQAQREREMYAPARALHQAARAAGAKTVLLMPWARRDGDPRNVPDDRYPAMQKRVAAAYLELGAELESSVAGVGFAWQKVLARRRDIALWAADGSHPTRAGSYLAACVLYATLFDTDPLGNGFHGGLAASEAEFLQRIASGVWSAQ